MKALGIILAGGYNRRIKELAAKRALAAMPVGGNYRCIDFALSNMTNSGIQTVAVISQFNTRSLNEHLNSSKWWNFGRKKGGLYIFTPMLTMENSNWYRGTADAIYQNIDFLKESHEPYVVISNGDIICKIDFNEVLEYHIAKHADITLVCRDMPEDTDFSRYGVIRQEEDGRIVDFEEKPVTTTGRTISCGMYIVRRKLLIDLLEHTVPDGKFNFVSDILVRYRNVKKIYGYKKEGYWKNIGDIHDYYQSNMDFLKAEVRNYFFYQSPRIYSKARDLPPAKFNQGSEVRNSLVASGCIINGKVENSVLFRQSFVGRNCIIRNSIIMSDVHIADNCHIENCIVESFSSIASNSEIVGSEDVKVVAMAGKKA